MVPPYTTHTIDLSFVIAVDKIAFATIENDFVYDMFFAPPTYVTDINKSNNNAQFAGSYTLNSITGSVQDDL